MNFKQITIATVRIVKRVSMLTVLIAAIFGIGATTYLYPRFLIDNARAAQLETKLKGYTDQEEADMRLGQYAINMMVMCEKSLSKDKRLSQARKQVLAGDIVRTTNGVFESIEHRHAMIAVWAIESCFQKFAKSPTGPKGLSQVSHAAFTEAMAACGVTDFSDSDVWDDTINLLAGSCYFRQQLKNHDNDIFQALVAYNQGPASDSVKTYTKNGNLSAIEPLKYIAKFTYLSRNVSDKKTSN